MFAGQVDEVDTTLILSADLTEGQDLRPMLRAFVYLLFS
jgi:hypothetical protein